MVNLDNLKKIIQYERDHPVDTYLIGGVHVWPLLRNALCWDFYSKAKPYKRIFFSKLQYLIFKSILFLKPNFSKKINSESEVLCLFPSQRRVKMHGVSYSIYADPLGDLLDKFRIRYSSLEYGKLIDKPSIRYSKNITDSLKWRLRFDRVLNKTEVDQPEWFSEYSALCIDVMGREIAWTEVLDLLFILKTYTNFFEEIYSKLRVKFVFIICWFDLLSMASIIAAKRSGVTSIEMQHGYQGLNHSAYSMWLRSPEKGYEMVPDIFWCWGDDSKSELEHLSPALLRASSALSGGNLWLNKWIEENKAERVAESKNRILVVLQRDPLDMIMNVINMGCPEMEWIFRFHPARSNTLRLRDIEYIKSRVSKNVKFEYPEITPLYQSFLNVGLILTEGSVVALEALAFRLHSVIVGNTDLSRQALIDYKSFIQKGLMKSANSSSELHAILHELNFHACDDVNVSDIFSGSDLSEKVLMEILGK
jgi:hypothetical protein